ncbi:class I SAM-dependent methyltransferase [Hymenobacter caeli]|uniref:SAM-dependent methyltransferase n=1 Tax=Hymenobacter caeli TaxID=2735894 RepID=A0ABX2FPX9_9BACT|nr:class I SAM-dependent methyltransferase [Hymenobacter caeli]NRT19231.1 SAM-dependent methyltransferase [Hymenobacter caeli]
MPPPSPADAAHYLGDELVLAEHATHWKAYYGALLRPYLRGRVLEVGAGIGGTTRALCDGRPADWLCLEPDAALAAQLRARRAAGGLPPAVRLRVGTLAALPAAEGLFDAVLYVNVVEHIEDDAAELARAYARLAPGGHLLVLVPAHQWLFSRFDAAIGHFRRYSRARLRRALPTGGRVRRLVYLDSLGLLAAAASKLLRQTYPTLAQVRLWDRGLVPVSRRLDRLLGYGVGKSVLAVVENPG